MAGPRQTNTFIEGLQALQVEIARMKLIPDADVEFLGAMEDMVIARAKDIFLGQQNTGAAASRGMPGEIGGGAEAAAGLGGPEMGGLGPEGAVPVTPGGPPPGVAPLPPTVAPEQIERLLTRTA